MTKNPKNTPADWAGIVAVLIIVTLILTWANQYGIDRVTP